MKATAYIARLSTGTGVVLKGIDHPKAGQQCTITGILHNPSGAPPHQWYDVKFRDGSIGRFLEKYLSPVLPESRPDSSLCDLSYTEVLR